MQLSRPTLIVVTGPPAAGKSTLAALLSQRLRLPVVSRDAIKLSLVRTTESGPEELVRGGEVARRSFELFLEAVGFHLDRSLSLIAEQAFERGKGEEDLRPFLDRCDLVQIVCEVSQATAMARFEARLSDGERANPADVEVLAMLREGRLAVALFGPLDLNGITYRLDGSDIGSPAWVARVDALVEQLR